MIRQARQLHLHTYIRRACGHVDVGTCPHQVLAAPLALSQPRGADYAHPILVSTPSFESHRRACICMLALFQSGGGTVVLGDRLCPTIGFALPIFFFLITSLRSRDKIKERQKVSKTSNRPFEVQSFYPSALLKQTKPIFSFLLTRTYFRAP